MKVAAGYGDVQELIILASSDRWSETLKIQDKTYRWPQLRWVGEVLIEDDQGRLAILKTTNELYLPNRPRTLRWKSRAGHPVSIQVTCRYPIVTDKHDTRPNTTLAF